MEYDSVVVPSFRKFCEVFACLIIITEIYMTCMLSKKKYIHEVHGPNTTPVVHRPNLSQVRPSPCLLCDVQ